MSEGRKSLHVIVVMGGFAVGAMIIMMMTSMEGLQNSPAGTRAKLASLVAERFGFDRAGASFAHGELYMTLEVDYETSRFSEYDLDAQNEEMEQVAKFLYRESLKYEDPEFYQTEEIRVKRVEVMRSGCSESRVERDFTLPIPRRVPKEGTEEK